MKNNITTIIKKEFVRFFTDKKLVVSMIVLPGVLIYVMYSFMGTMMMNEFNNDADYVTTINVQNMPQSLETVFASVPNTEIITVASNTADSNISESQIMRDIKNKDTDIFIVFPANFDEDVATYGVKSITQAPQIKIFYNSTKKESRNARSMAMSLLDSYEATLINKFDVNAGETKYDLASEKESTGQLFASMLPMLLMLFLYTSCMGISVDSIAGEKERGTIATMLVTPMKRQDLALGKIISLSILGLLSGASSFLGTVFSLPKLMGGVSDGMNVSVYGASEFLLILLIILSTTLVIVAVMAVISALAKSVKEASTGMLPIMLIIMVVSISSMMNEEAKTAFYWYVIPFYNSLQSFSGIFSFTGSVANVAITIVSNLVYTFALSIGLAKIFKSEKIMYS